MVVVVAVLASLVQPGRLSADDPPEPLAPLVPEVGKRQATLIFRYEKTVREQVESKGGKGDVGGDKLNSTLRIVIEGRAEAELPDLNYLDSHTKTVKTPAGEVKVPIADTAGLMLDYGYAETAPDRGDHPRLTRYSRRTNVSGEHDNYHYSMNIWGPPTPKWIHVPLKKTSGSGSEQANSCVAASKDSHDLWKVSWNTYDLDKSFTWGLLSGCPVTEDYTSESNDPPHGSPTSRETRKNTENVDFSFPNPDRLDGWTRSVQRTKSGLTATCSRTKQTVQPPKDQLVCNIHEVTEKATFHLDLDVGDYELVITPPKDLENWVPKGGRSDNEVGDKLVFKGEIRRKSGAAAKKTREIEVNAELTSSHQPGVCANTPAKSKGKTDLRFIKTSRFVIDGPTGTGEERTSTATGVFTPGEKFDLTVGCYDYGAFGDIFFSAPMPVRIEGYPDDEAIPLPRDKNHNRIADAWETSEKVFDKNLDPLWDGVQVAGHRADGDGFCLYERYRGVFNNYDSHFRLKCDTKYVFLFDPANLVRKSGSSLQFNDASQVTPIFIKASQWTGPGSYTDHKRVVNFNYVGAGGMGRRHLCDQHALYVVPDATLQESGKDVAQPAGWAKVYQKAGVTPPLDDLSGLTLGNAWGDCVPIGGAGISPRDCYQVSVYTTNIKAFIWQNGESVMTGRTDDDKTNALLAYYGAHPTELQAGVDGATRWIVCHELGHGIGTHDHGIGTGNARCFMRNSTALASLWRAPDPLGAAFAWPTIFCREAGHLGACFPSIQVTDYREPKK